MWQSYSKRHILHYLIPNTTYLLILDMISTQDPIGLMHMRVSNAKVNRIICRFILVHRSCIFKSTDLYNHSHWGW